MAGDRYFDQKALIPLITLLGVGVGLIALGRALWPSA